MSPIDPNLTVLVGEVKKRTVKACNRCRIKKSKCDGPIPCRRCRKENAICVFRERRTPSNRAYPKGYVELLESQHAQLVRGLQKLYQQLQIGSMWIGAPLEVTSSGLPLTHDILERLGVFEQDDHATKYNFEENLNVLQQKLDDGDGVDLMYDQPSNASCSDSSSASYLDHFVARESGSSGSCITDQGPARRTKPSPHPRAPAMLSATSHFSQVPYAQFDPGRTAVPPELYYPREFNKPFDASVLDSTMYLPTSCSVVWEAQSGPAVLNLCPAMEDWGDREDVLRFLGSS